MYKYIAYLAGPITGLTYGDAVDWREQIKKLLPGEITGMSPMRCKQYLKKHDKIKSGYSEYPLSTPKGIKTRDKNDCKRSNVLIINVLGAKTVSIGTVLEIGWADSFGIPSILIMEEEGNIHDHPMIRESVGFVVQTIEDAALIASAILLPN